MLKSKFLWTLMVFFMGSTMVLAQDSELLTKLPTTKEGYAETEKAVINTVNWLENTPRDQDPEQYQLLSKNVFEWISNSPTVTVELNQKVLPFAEKNPHLVGVFLGGWVKYALENDHSKDAVKCTLAGLQSVVKVCKAGNGGKIDKQIKKIIDLESKGKLESWIIEQLK